ncbi:hypothetical protein OHB54_03455 [Streptomyces sp. NBC_01007]|nr:hypothetical protein OHB54_03455 [Streptomyces sp. NBC_01007]
MSEVGSRSNRGRRYTEEFERDAAAFLRSSGQAGTPSTDAVRIGGPESVNSPAR